MSDTPQVDAFMRVEGCSNNNPVAFDWLVGLARSLERENAELSAWKEGKKGVEDYLALKHENAELRKKLAEAEESLAIWDSVERGM